MSDPIQVLAVYKGEKKWTRVEGDEGDHGDRDEHLGAGGSASLGGMLAGAAGWSDNAGETMDAMLDGIEASGNNLYRRTLTV